MGMGGSEWEVGKGIRCCLNDGSDEEDDGMGGIAS
jgi:hypothetical protein